MGVLFFWLHFWGGARGLALCHVSDRCCNGHAFAMDMLYERFEYNTHTERRYGAAMRMRMRCVASSSSLVPRLLVRWRGHVLRGGGVNLAGGQTERLAFLARARDATPPLRSSAYACSISVDAGTGRES